MRVEADGIQIKEDGDIISITLPPSKYSRTVTITKHTPNHVLVTENTSSTNTIPLYNAPSTPAPDVKGTVLEIDVGGSTAISGDASAVDVSTINSALGTLDLAGPSWKQRSWVVVIRGRDIGIFYDFWARIWPLIKLSEQNIIPGASWKKADSKEDALNKWALAVEEGLADRIF